MCQRGRQLAERADTSHVRQRIAVPERLFPCHDLLGDVRADGDELRRRTVPFQTKRPAHRPVPVRSVLRPNPILVLHPFWSCERLPRHGPQTLSVLGVQMLRPPFDGSGKLTRLVAQRLVHVSVPLDASRLVVGFGDDVRR